MEIIEKRYLIIVKGLSEKIIVDDQLEALLCFNKLYVFLWFREGLFCIIPEEIINNALNLIDIYVKSGRKTTPPEIFFIWDQGIPVDPKVGYALLGEQSNN